MKRVAIAVAGLLVVLVVVALAVVPGRLARRQGAHPAAAAAPPIAGPAGPDAAGTRPSAEDCQGLLYGRITTFDDATFEGRLRWGGDEEAFWSDPFNGARDGNRWETHVPPELLQSERRPFEILGVEIGGRTRRIDLERPFMARFGDLRRIDARGRAVRVTLKSGATHELDRLEAGDIDDGVRVWDGRRGVVDLDSLRIRSIEFLPTPALDAAPARLHGIVRTRQGEFAGFVQWNGAARFGDDVLDGRTAEGELRVRFDAIRSIAREPGGGVLTVLYDGREIAFPGGGAFGSGHRGVHVDDRRFGRVLISWDAFERVDFEPGGSGPAYDDFPPGGPLTGSVTTRGGERLTGRLVYDLDESETVETLDAPAGGLAYTIPFGLIASILPSGGDEGDASRARVTLHGGDELWLEPQGDLDEGNGGMLIFIGEGQRARYVPWADVERIDLDRPAAMYPTPGARPEPAG